jgi:predicted  nucleic acid-binding Zn-ribbon protein
MLKEDETVEERVARLEADVSNIRTDISEMKVDIRELRTSLAQSRLENQREFATVRTEMQGIAKTLRDEIRELRDAQANMRREITRTSLTDRIWMLMTGATILGIMAHGFKWI